jgi:ABC-type sugar transport system ATPase subunit
MREEIFDRIRSIQASGVAVLMVEQNATEALRIASRAYVMVAGRNVLEQSGAEMLANPDVGRLFLGREESGGGEAGGGDAGARSTPTLSSPTPPDGAGA